MVSSMRSSSGRPGLMRVRGGGGLGSMCGAATIALFRWLVAIAVVSVLVLVTAGGSKAASETPLPPTPATVPVGAEMETTIPVLMKAGVRYHVIVTGTAMTGNSSIGSSSYDALYCFQSSSPSNCNPPFPEGGAVIGFALRPPASPAPFQDQFQAITAFGDATVPNQPYNGSHSYEQYVTPTLDSNLYVMTWPGYPPGDGIPRSGSFTVTVLGPPPQGSFVVIHPSNLDAGANVDPRDIGALDFGNVQAGRTEAPEQLTVTNTGVDPLRVKTVTAPTASGFNVRTDTCVGQTVQHGASCTVDVTFTAPTVAAGSPSQAYEKSGELQITDDQGTVYYVSLRGTSTPDHNLAAAVSRSQGQSYSAQICAGHSVGGPLLPFLPDAGWALASSTPTALRGQVVEGHVATEDFTGLTDHTYHVNADYNFFVYPDQGYRTLLNVPGNFIASGEYTPSEAGRIEVEWERSGGSAPSSGGLPEWAWPTVGDKVHLLGSHILDCGHGGPDFRSEIHPPMIVATFRNAALSPYAGAYGRLGSYDPVTHLPATRIDLFASSYGGPAVGIERGQSPIQNTAKAAIAQPAQCTWWQPLGDYGFDALAPPKPSPHASLAPPRVKVRESVGQSQLSYTPLPSGNGFHISLQFSNVNPCQLADYGASIWLGWTDPTKPAPAVSTYEVTPESIAVEVPLTGKWGLYAYVNELAAGSIFSGDGTTSLHERYHYVQFQHTYPLYGDHYAVTLVRNQSLHVAFRVTAYGRSVGGFTNFGTGYSGGTAAIFYPNPTFTDKTVTLRGADTLGDPSLGRDEYTTSKDVAGKAIGPCPCFKVTFRVRKLSTTR